MANRYDIKWTRPEEDEVFECHDLTAATLVRRLTAAAKNFGQITVLEVTRHGK